MNEYLNMCCQKDNLVACHSIAENYELEQNYDKAVEYYIMNCDKGYAGSCTNLGILYHVGDKIKQDYKKPITISVRLAMAVSLEDVLVLVLHIGMVKG